MELQNLKYFLTIASEGSFNKAATVLFMSQPSLSKAIANLEKELNVELFKRNRRGVELTESGKKLFEYAKIVIAQLELIEGLSSHDSPSITLTIASYPMPIISTLVARFYHKYDHKHMGLRYYVGRLGKVLELIKDGTCEIGIVTSDPAQNQKLNSILRSSDLEAIPLGTDQIFAVVGPKNPLYNQAQVNMKDLIDLPTVRFRDDYFSNLSYFLEIDGVKLTEIKHEIFVDDNLDIQNFLLETNAFSFQLGINRSYFEARNLKVLKIKNSEFESQVWCIKQRKTKLSSYMEELVQNLKTMYMQNT